MRNIPEHGTGREGVLKKILDIAAVDWNNAVSFTFIPGKWRERVSYGMEKGVEKDDQRKAANCYYQNPD